MKSTQMSRLDCLGSRRQLVPRQFVTTWRTRLPRWLETRGNRRFWARTRWAQRRTRL